MPPATSIIVLFFLLQLTAMPRSRLDPKQATLRRQERNQRYRTNQETKERNREYDRLYRQRKREQARLQQHQDPLAQLADVSTQQHYLEETNSIDDSIIVESIEGPEELIEVGGIIEENGEVLENFGNSEWDEGFNDGEDYNISENGNKFIFIS